MKIRIHRRNKETPSFDAFVLKEWSIADKEHYGKDVDWKPKCCVLEAKVNNEIVGILKGKVILGVCEIEQVLVTYSKRGKDIGKMLMEECENIARELLAHKLYLITGENWEAVHFYRALGYGERGRLANHFMKKDFIVFEKLL